MFNGMKKIHYLLLGLIAGVASLQPADAQNRKGQLDLMIPSVGVMLPLSDVVESGAISTGSPAAAHEVSVTFGARLTYWFLSEMGLELELGFAPSSLESEAFGVPGTVEAQFFELNGRLVYDFRSSPASAGFLLTGGIGLFATNYDEFEMTPGGMGVVSLGYRIPLDTSLALQFDLSDYLTTTNWELNDGSETDKILQNDVVLSVGLIITLN